MGWNEGKVSRVAGWGYGHAMIYVTDTSDLCWAIKEADLTSVFVV